MPLVCRLHLAPENQDVPAVRAGMAAMGSQRKYTASRQRLRAPFAAAGASAAVGSGGAIGASLCGRAAVPVPGGQIKTVHICRQERP